MVEFTEARHGASPYATIALVLAARRHRARVARDGALMSTGGAHLNRATASSRRRHPARTGVRAADARPGAPRQRA